MPLTILFDLDDTLLSLKVEVFIPAYIQTLAASIDLAPSSLISSALIEASNEMVRKSVPANTLETTFDSHFYPSISLSKEQLQPAINNFYQNIYPSLKQYTSSRPVMVEIIKTCLNAGHKIVIATNPLFPRTAILQRLDWAGFGDFKHRFDIITSYESFHFAKPHPEYFLEILAQLGWPEQPAVMIGNSYRDDIVPAEENGLPVFYLQDQIPPHYSGPQNALSQMGNIEQILPWLNKVEKESAGDSFNLSAAGYLNGLRVTPAVVDTLVKGIHQSRQNDIIALLEKAIKLDTSLMGGSDQYNFDSRHLQSACQNFLLLREKLVQQIKDSSLMINVPHLFEADRDLLSSLKNIQG